MGDEPCPVVPVPKKIELRTSADRWPKFVKVTTSGSIAKSFTEGFKALRPASADGYMEVRLDESDCACGGYQLEFSPGAIVVSAGDAAGFRHALQTLRQMASQPTMPVGIIADHPSLAIRGFHLNLASYRRVDVNQAIHLIETAARFRLNTMLVEYGDRFPFEAHAGLRGDLVLTPDEVGRLNEAATDQGIELIPLQQSLAHLDYALGHDSLVHLREDRAKPGLMCPTDPASLALFKTLASEVLRGHPQAKWFHLGGDEARKIGRCERCRAAVGDQSAGVLYGRYIGDAARWLLDQGVRPIVWDDTLCALPEAFNGLPKELVIDYWDYIAVADPTPVLIPRMAHQEGGPRVAHDWWWTLPNRRRGLMAVQAGVMERYSSPCRMKSKLGGSYMREFGRYLGSDFPRWVKALPYLEYYQDRGHAVITSPTGMGNGDTADGVPNFERFEHNIRTHARRCKANGRALGVITTAWYNMPPELLYQPLVRTAQCAW